MNDINSDWLSSIKKRSSMEPSADSDIPQWKKDLIARLRSQNRTATAAGSGSDQQQQLSVSPQLSSADRAGHQPSSACKSESVTSGVSCPHASAQCNVISTTCSQPRQHKMVQERVWVDGKHDPFAEAVNDNYANNGYHKDSDDEDSDSSEDLHYGPGIVNKLKNKYLSLALRESNTRPSILHMRKATSLENLLDDNVPNGNIGNRQFRSRLNGNDTDKNVPNRYRHAARGEMKRAHSVEAISRFDHHLPLISEVRPNRQSLHEEMLIAAEKEGNDHLHRKMLLDNQLEANAENKFNSNNVGARINRPKRIQPIMNEKEKPPADVVKQTKMIFERRPEQRTKAPPQTGDVAAKVDSFNNIIVKNKVDAKTVTKKPPIKHAKPVLNDKPKSNTRSVAKPVVVSEEVLKSPPPPRSLELNKVPRKDFRDDLPLPSPIPDVSRIDFHNKGENERGKNGSSLSETPDLILTSSPLSAVSSPTYNKKNLTENFLREEILSSSPLLPRSPLRSPTNRSVSPLLSPARLRPVSPLSSPRKTPSPTNVKPVSLDYDEEDSVGAGKKTSPTPSRDTKVFNFTNQKVNQSHLPLNKNVSNTKTPTSQPLKIEINGHNEGKPATASPRLLQTQPSRSPPKFSPPPPPPKIEEAVVVVEKPTKSLTVTEIEKNLINTVKTLQQPNKGSGVVSVSASVEVVNRSIVTTKKGRPREPASNTAVFNFTGRKDVPDYISNDRSRSPGRPELPKVNMHFLLLSHGGRGVTAKPPRRNRHNFLSSVKAYL